jgi:hypothetical protein
MSKFSSSLLGLGLSLLMASGLLAQRYHPIGDDREHTLPAGSAGANFNDGGGTIATPTNSGFPDPLVITAQNAPYNGQGSVDVKFSMNQRARVLLAVYRIGSNATGVTGPHGAWTTVTPGDQYVNHIPLAPYEAGNSTITWDGNDWEGNAAGPGNYEFDLIGFNDLDAGKVTIVGPWGGAWGPNVVDTRVEPAEVWSPFQETPPTPYGRGVIGTDYIANPGAIEVWSVTAFGADEERNRSGHVPDDVSLTTHWTSRQRPNEALGLLGGVIKLTRNDVAKTMDVDESFGDNGLSVSRGATTWQLAPHENTVYVCFTSEELQTTVIEKYDKTSGERVSEIDMFENFHIQSLDEDGNEFTRILGPYVLAVNDNGIWTTSHNTNARVHLDHDGNVRWINGLGDNIGDWVSNETAAELGLLANLAPTVGYGADPTGKMSYGVDTHNSLGYQLTMIGRGPAGLANVEFNPATGPFSRGNNTKHIQVINEGGKYDGLYIGGQTAENAPGGTAFPEMGLANHLPYDLATGLMGAGVTAVEENGPASTPDSYVLGDAYPNPFNPETTIEFNVPSEGRVKIEIYNTAGQLVTSLVDEELTAGSYKTTWDARDESGALMASGVYFYRMLAGDFADTRTMTLLK